MQDVRDLNQFNAMVIIRAFIKIACMAGDLLLQDDVLGTMGAPFAPHIAHGEDCYAWRRNRSSHMLDSRIVADHKSATLQNLARFKH